MAALYVPSEYAYVLFVAVVVFFVLFYLAEKVVFARKTYDVPYPTMYSEKSKQFNCVQRAHQNALETLPFLLVFLMAGGLQHPLVSAGAGLVWSVGRLVYAYGYYTGDPKSRAPGAILSFLALFVLLGTTVSFGLHLLEIL